MGSPDRQQLERQRLVEQVHPEVRPYIGGQVPSVPFLRWLGVESKVLTTPGSSLLLVAGDFPNGLLQPDGHNIAYTPELAARVGYDARQREQSDNLRAARQALILGKIPVTVALTKSALENTGGWRSRFARHLHTLAVDHSATFDVRIANEGIEAQVASHGSLNVAYIGGPAVGQTAAYSEKIGGITLRPDDRVPEVSSDGYARFYENNTPGAEPLLALASEAATTAQDVMSSLYYLKSRQ